MSHGALCVVGGGPAGALAARGLALRGQRVTLLEARPQTDDKVCGACLHPAAVQELERAGLAAVLDEARAPELQTLELRRGARLARIQVALGRVLSRRALDEALLLAAVSAGVELRRGHSVRALNPTADGIEVSVREPSGSLSEHRFGVVLLAHGLGSLRASSAATATSLTGRAPQRARRERLGAGVILPASTRGPPRGELQMLVAPEGYLGIVRLEDERLDLAAAFDTGALRRAGGAAALAARILLRARHPLRELAQSARWRGTPALARPEAPMQPGVLRLGDAAGSVEPFTGEGLRRAFTQARLVVEHALAAASGDTQAGLRWSHARREALHANTARVNRLASALHHPRLMSLGVELAALWPAVGERLVRGLHGKEAHR